MVTQQGHRLQQKLQRLSGMNLRLQVLSPQGTLERGYAIVSRRTSGAVVTRKSQVQSGDSIDVRVSDGHFGGTVD
jgi:exodeoxyribonuclease VII large subunit